MRVTMRPSQSIAGDGAADESRSCPRTVGAHRSSSARQRRIVRGMARAIAGGEPPVCQVTRARRARRHGAAGCRRPDSFCSEAATTTRPSSLDARRVRAPHRRRKNGKYPLNSLPQNELPRLASASMSVPRRACERSESCPGVSGTCHVPSSPIPAPPPALSPPCARTTSPLAARVASPRDRSVTPRSLLHRSPDSSDDAREIRRQATSAHPS